LFFVPQLAATIIWPMVYLVLFCRRLFLLLASARTRTKQARETNHDKKELDTLVLFCHGLALSFMIAGLLLAQVRMCMCTRTRIRTRTHTHMRALHLQSIAIYFIRIFFPRHPMHELSAISLSSR